MLKCLFGHEYKEIKRTEWVKFQNEFYPPLPPSSMLTIVSQCKKCHKLKKETIKICDFLGTI